MVLYKKIEEQTFNILSELEINTPNKIDVFKIAKHLGVDVKPATLDSSISGLFVIKEQKPYIRYNDSEAPQRQKFTIAHELGHFVLHKDIPLFVEKNETVLYRNLDSTTGELLKEKEANSFAASLLMPKFMIDEQIENIPQGKDPVIYLSKIFKVSSQAMYYRLNNLSYSFLGMY
ncbi:ImmA/IrrE family metallo-endopeptidase [Flavobacterium sp.]|uniref:ImmA/IrrE family metallo-endopeptidase n=1 Tax=Flavobacterium sp. TaxID=239 RepID=UPI00404743BC